jgi:hypothetical protein
MSLRQLHSTPAQRARGPRRQRTITAAAANDTRRQPRPQNVEGSFFVSGERPRPACCVMPAWCVVACDPAEPPAAHPAPLQAPRRWTTHASTATPAGGWRRRCSLVRQGQAGVPAACASDACMRALAPCAGGCCGATLPHASPLARRGGWQVSRLCAAQGQGGPRARAAGATELPDVSRRSAARVPTPRAPHTGHATGQAAEVPPHPGWLATPRYSIHARDRTSQELKEAQEGLPAPVPGTSNVYHNGWHSEASFAAASYLITRPEGAELLLKAACPQSDERCSTEQHTSAACPGTTAAHPSSGAQFHPQHCWGRCGGPWHLLAGQPSRCHPAKTLSSRLSAA